MPGENTHLAQFYRDPFVGAALFFAFFMLTDPPTSPIRPRDQLIFGAGVAALAVTVELTRDTLTYMFVGLLIGNAWWAWRRVAATRMALARGTGAATPPAPAAGNAAAAPSCLACAPGPPTVVPRPARPGSDAQPGASGRR